MEQKELRQYAENILKDFDYHYSGYSDTNGQSMYFDVDGIKVRFSDHSVSNRDRMSNEIHFDLNRIGTEWSNFNVEQRLLELRYRLGDKNIKFGKRQILMPSGKYLEAFGYSSNKTYAQGGYVTYKDKYNKKYGYAKNTSHTLEEVSKDTGVSMKGLQQIYNKGIGAYKTNPSSVRPNVKSKEQWAMARVYSAVMGGKASNIDSNELKMEKGGLAPNGKKSNLTAQQFKLVRTKAFKDWFGDWENDPANASKVVDENGEPKVYYQGLPYRLYPNGKNIYEQENNGIFFTSEKEIAYTYGKDKSVFINCRNPKDVRNYYGYDGKKIPNSSRNDDKHWFKTKAQNEYLNSDLNVIKFYEDVIDKYGESLEIFDYYNGEIVLKNKHEIKKFLIPTSEKGFAFLNFRYRSAIWDLIGKYIKNSQYDGLFATDEDKLAENISDSIVVYNSNQIKLANGTNTTFNGSNPDIRFEEGGLIAPNGKSSNLTPEQYKLVRSESFKAWFGDWENDPENASKVVDENGEPLVVWHGSKSFDINEFDLSKSKRKSSGLKEFGTYFTDNTNLAKAYRNWGELKEDEELDIDIQIYKWEKIRDESRNNRDYQNAEEQIARLEESKKGRIYGVFLNLKKLYVFDAKGGVNIEAWNNLEVKASYKWATNRDAMEFLKEGKFGVEKVDGIKAENIVDAFVQTEELKKELLSNVYLVFDSKNIKLSDGTNTTFDGSNPDIRFEEGGQITNYTEFYDSLVIEDGSKYIGKKFNDVFPFLSRGRKTPHFFRMKVKQYEGEVERLKKDNYTTPSKKTRDLNKLEAHDKSIDKYKYLARFYLDQKGTIIDFIKTNKIMEKGGMNWYGKGGIKERFAEGGQITQYEIESMRNYINSDNPNPKLKESFEKVLRKFGVDLNTSDLSKFPKGKYINTYDFSGYEYMSSINEQAGVFFLLTGEYQLVSKAIFEKDYSMWLFYNYLGRINISMKACQDWLNQAQDYFESSMPIPIFLVHTPRAKDGRSYAMWCAVSEGRKEQAQSRIGRPLTYSYKNVYYYQEIGLVGNYDFNNDGWGTLYTEKKTGLLIPEYTETSFHFNTLIHEFAHCLDFQTQLLSNIEKFESKTPEQKETYLNTENMTEAELALYSKQLTKEALKQDNVAVPITNHFDEFVDSLIRILRACAGGNIPLTQLYEQQALDVQQALAGKYGDLLLEQRIKRAKEAKELSKEEELRDNTRFSWQTSWIYDIKEYALQNSVNADLKAKISSKSKYALSLVEALELDNLITGYFNTEFKKYMLTNPTKATQRLEDIKELKKETNRIINNHYDNVKANYNYGYKPNSELELYIRNNCDIRNFRDYKSWKECAKEKLQSFQ